MNKKRKIAEWLVDFFHLADTREKQERREQIRALRECLIGDPVADAIVLETIRQLSAED